MSFDAPGKKKSFQLRDEKRDWPFDDLVGDVPLDSICCPVEGSVAVYVCPELKHPTTKHLAQILGNKIPRILRARTHAYSETRTARSEGGPTEVPARVPWIIVFLGRGEDDAAEL